MTYEPKFAERTARLGVNIDHVATLRQLRNTPYPSITEAAQLAERAGAQLITIHLREDRRHIQDDDVRKLRESLRVPMNLEMALSDSIARFAVKMRPQWTCIVPERRQEVTTEGGLDVKKSRKKLSLILPKLKKAEIKVSLFIEPSIETVQMSADLGVDAVEFHTGRYCLAAQEITSKPAAAAKAEKELKRIEKAAIFARECGLGVHAGHGIDYENIRVLAALENPDRTPLIEEFNIGHVIVCRAVLVGLEQAVREMKSAIEAP